MTFIIDVLHDPSSGAFYMREVVAFLLPMLATVRSVCLDLIQSVVSHSAISTVVFIFGIMPVGLKRKNDWNNHI